MEHNYRRFVASSELFQGYTTTIDLNKCDSLIEIINIFVSRLQSVLIENKLEALVNKMNSGTRFHIHDYTFNDIRQSPPDTIYYICDHC